jgi:tetratricopeptide (TPR) repeat protein
MNDSLRIEEIWRAVRDLVRNGQGWKAKTLLKEMLAIAPCHHAARIQYAEILQADGELSEALVQCAFAFKHGAENKGLAARMGDLYLAGGMNREAADCYVDALKREDANDELLRKLERCRAVMGEEMEVN